MKEKTLKKLELAFYYSIRLVILISFIFALLRYDWAAAFWLLMILLFTYLPSLIESRYRVYLPLEFEIFIVTFVFLSLFLGEMHDYYHKVSWWDLWLHLESGFLLGIFGIIMIYILNEQKNVYLRMKAGFVAFFAFTFSMTAAVFWEFFEFFMDQTFGWNMMKSGLVDTMWDLIFAAFGAFVVSLLAYYWMKKRINFFVFNKSIRQFVKNNSHLYIKKEYGKTKQSKSKNKSRKSSG